MPAIDANPPRSADEATALAALKKVIAGEKAKGGLPPGEDWADLCDDGTKLRFLRGHGLKPAEAFKLLKKAGAWRRDYKADNLIHSIEVERKAEPLVRAARAYIPMGIVAHDADGRPIMLDRLAAVDFVRAIQEFGLETVMVFAFYLQEKLLERNPTQEAIIILDLGQDDLENPPIGSLFEARAWVGAFLKFLQPFAAWADPYYAELYHRIFIVRAPSFFAATWAVAKTFIAENTVAKIQIFTSGKSDKALTAMRELMTDDMIPELLGGKNKCVGMGRGGKLPKGNVLDEKVIQELENSTRVPAPAPVASTPERAAQNAELTRVAALETLRHAVAQMHKQAGHGESNQRGSWRFVPGLDVLDEIDDATLEAALRAHEDDPEKAFESLQRVAAQKEKIVVPQEAPPAGAAGKDSSSNNNGSTGVLGAFSRMMGSFSKRG